MPSFPPVAALAAAVFCTFTSAVAARDTLPAPVLAALFRAQIPVAAFGMVVMPLAGRGPSVTWRAGESMQPASTMKLVTSVVALERLGPNHRGHTLLATAAPQAGDVLQGDLVLKGGADPELGIPQLWALLAELRWSGVREIAGDLVLDRSLFRPARIDLGLPAFDDAPEFPYNVIPDALMLAGNLLPIDLRADGEAVQARLVPPLPGVAIVNRLQLDDRPCPAWNDTPYWQTPLVTQRGNGLTIELSGFFPRHCQRRQPLQLFDRNLLADALVRQLWRELGGSWNGRTVEGITPPGARVLARRDARPWGEVLRHMNKVSDNAETRLLFLSLGAAAASAGTSANNGANHTAMTTLDFARREVQRWFAEARIDATGIVVDNGSGLSRSERITPMQLARMLKTALNGKNAPDLLMSLPTAGIDGTMRLRLRNTPAQGWARVKTGTLRNVAALAGLVPDADGRPWVMAAMVNHEGAGSQGRPVLDALVQWIAAGGMTMRPGADRVGPLAEGP